MVPRTNISTVLLVVERVCKPPQRSLLDPRTPHHQASRLYRTHCQDPQSCSIFMDSNIAEGKLGRGTSFQELLRLESKH
jgi:hypothetical protein